MSILKKYGLIAALVIPVIILVVIRLSDINRFKTDAQKWAEPSISKSIILSPEQAAKIQGKILFISDLEKDKLPIPTNDESQLLSIDEVLSKPSLKILQNHKGPVFISSKEESISARIWMLISQMGYDKVYIITNKIIEKG